MKLGFGAGSCTVYKHPNVHFQQPAGQALWHNIGVNLGVDMRPPSLAAYVIVGREGAQSMRIEKVENRAPRRKQYSCGVSFRRCAAHAQTGAAELVKSPGRPHGMPVRTQTEQRFPFDFAVGQPWRPPHAKLRLGYLAVGTLTQGRPLHLVQGTRRVGMTRASHRAGPQCLAILHRAATSSGPISPPSLRERSKPN
jgi:hypothetical protein